MSSQYNTEPPPTASVLLHTTAGPLTISLFANQTPLTCRNFLQHVLDGYYNNNIFHRVSSGFVIQTGDPTGTGEGGENIYEDREFEKYDGHWARLLGREKDERIVFRDEIHSRLKFNRRGLVGLAKGTGDSGGYGSQFFITLGDCRAQLDGRCTMFGRVEGEGIYNIVRIAEGELVDGTERPIYPERIIKAELLQMPQGDAWQAMNPRQRISERIAEESVKKKVVKKKAGKALLSFGRDEGDEESSGFAVRPKKAKFNPNLIDGNDATSKTPHVNEKVTKPEQASTKKGQIEQSSSPKHESKPQIPQKRKPSSPSPTPARSSASPDHRRKPSFHDSTTQLPIRDPESASRSPTPENKPTQSKTSALEAEIAALKASMRRDVGPSTADTKRKQSALESLIPITSTRGRKRPKSGQTNPKDDANALKMLNAFKARLDNTKSIPSTITDPISKTTIPKSNGIIEPNNTETMDEEATLCDLHFIANCQSCSNWDQDTTNETGDINDKNENDDIDDQWMNHTLTFEKDRLGKDLTWKRKNEEELMVIDPREKEKEIRSKDRDKGRKFRN